MRLVIEDLAGTRSVVPFARDEIVVGRGTEGVTFRLLDRDVSRRHARFVRSSGAIFVEDLGTLTGTRVNGERLSGRRRLREGDLVEIGDYDLAVLPDDEGDRPGAPPPIPGPVAPAPGPVAATPGRAEPAAPSPPPRVAPAGVAAPRPASPPLRRAVVVGVIALLLGVVAGVCFGLATHAPPPPVPAGHVP
jgi:predicted component of type VI protein secretion system